MPVYRIEVRANPGQSDPKAAAVMRETQSIGLLPGSATIETAGVYLIQGSLAPAEVRRVAEELLADPITETSLIGAAPPRADALIEVHPLPGVMDPDAEAVELAIKAMLGADVSVRTGRRYDVRGLDRAAAVRLAEGALANTLIHAIHDQPYHPANFPAGSRYSLKVVDVPLRNLSDAELVKLSREAHWFLSLEEMKAIAAEYRRLGREPREIEMETIAQTWSEHCVHKTLKSTVRYREVTDSRSPGIAIPGLHNLQHSPRAGHVLNPDGSITIHNLLKSTIAAATHELMADGIDWCLSVFVDNAGIIAFDDKHAVCFKCETHNHPSALEPYGGAATGIGGCIRDIIGTGLAAKPIAATDVFCVAHPDHWKLREDSSDRAVPPIQNPKSKIQNVTALPSGVIHPRRILTQIVAGVRDYGNRMGIPTLNGAVWFDDAYIGNPLVYCGCIGVMPRDMIRGEVRAGDRIIALGGRTGRDGIHGATFSSAELTDTHADEFSHAVQIGNAVTEKKVLDAILGARDNPSENGGCLFHAITDCGAGGFSSAVGEMGSKLGAAVNLEQAPLKYEGLSPTEIWISEAQERMVLAVPPENVQALGTICDANEVELADLGVFGAPNHELMLNYQGVEVGRLSMNFLHDGIPSTTREAVWQAPKRTNAQTQKTGQKKATPSIEEALLALLAHPNIASKHWIIRQYDHEVQGNTKVKPLIGPRADGPSDAAIITPVAGSSRGLAIANGLATNLSDDPYIMAIAAVDECVRNLVCVGADPSRIAILDNFCWPSCDDPHVMAGLVRAAEGCYDATKAYRTPFISGKDSLNNQFTPDDGRTIRIPPTLLISGIGIVPNIKKAVTMDAKRAGNVLMAVGGFGGLERSHYEALFGIYGEKASVMKWLFGEGPTTRALAPSDLQHAPIIAHAVHEAIARGWVRAAHDCSDGGFLVAAAEMTIAGDLGLDLEQMDWEAGDYGWDIPECCFAEGIAGYLLEIEPEAQHDVESHFWNRQLPCSKWGTFNDSSQLQIGKLMNVRIDDLRAAWRGGLDW